VAQRLLAGLLALAGLIALVSRPLVGFVLLAGAGAVFLDTRGAFGRGRFRAAIAFISSLWLTVGGSVATLLGLIPGAAPCQTETCASDAGNFVFAPGLILLALGLTLLVWSMVYLPRTRRAS